MIYQRVFGFQNPLLFLKWDDVIPVDVVRRTVNPYLDNNSNVNLTDSVISNDLLQKIHNDPMFQKKLEEHKKLIKKRPEDLTPIEKQMYKEIMKDRVFQSYELRQKVTPETLKDIIDSKMASNLLKPLSSIDMIMYIGIGLAVGFLLAIALQSFGIIPKMK